MEEERGKVSFPIRMSAKARAAQLFKDELDIDQGHNNPQLNMQFLEGTLAQRDLLIQQRDKILNGFLITLCLIAFVTNGEDLTVPGLGISLYQFPALKPTLSIASSFMLLMLVLMGNNIAVYSGLITQYANKLSEASPIDPDMFEVSWHPQWLVLKIFRKDFQYLSSVTIKPTPLTAALYSLSNFMVGQIFLFLIASMYVFILYFIFVHLGDSILEIGAKVVSCVLLISALFIHLLANWKLSHSKTVLVRAGAEGASETSQ